MWARFCSVALGVWLMSSPAVLGLSQAAATNNHIVGPLVVTAALVALSEVTKPVRWVNLLLGVWLLLAPWLLSGFTEVARINSLLVGGVLIPLALVPQVGKHEVGGGWRVLWKDRSS